MGVKTAPTPTQDTNENTLPSTGIAEDLQTSNSYEMPSLNRNGNTLSNKDGTAKAS